MYPLRWKSVWLGLGWSMIGATVLLSLMPAPPGPPGLPDKIAHALTYGALALWFCGIYHRSRHWRVALWLLGLGVTLEVLQGAGDARHPEPADAVANAVGIVLALLIARAGMSGWCARVEGLPAALRDDD